MLNSGSDRLYVSPKFAQELQIYGLEPQSVQSEIQIANGKFTAIAESYTIRLSLAQQTFEHVFHVLPGLNTEMLVGVDLWAKFGFNLPPPPLSGFKKLNCAYAISDGLCLRTPTEEIELRRFLDNELRLFQNVKGPTNRIHYHLC